MEDLSQNESSCLRVFGIPELAGIICGLGRRRDNVNLLRVCRQMFYDVCPIVWESTDAVVSIVSMIPGGGIVLDGDDLLPSFAIMQFPSTLDLSRLRLYAPYVRNLEIPLQLLVDRYENWDGFLSATRSTSLLPNLEHIHLSLERFKTLNISEETVNWVTAFLSTSLLSLSIASGAPSHDIFSFPKYSLVNFGLANRLLDDISKKCPEIDSLELYIGRGVARADGFWRQCVEFEGDQPFGPSPGMPSILSQFPTLRTLTITSLRLLEDVSILAQLPLLESLTVHSLRSRGNMDDQRLTLPDDSFPSLRHLELHVLTWEFISSLYPQATIWRGLRSLRVDCLRPYRWSQVDDHPHLLSAIISSLADHGGPISTLTITGATHQSISTCIADSLKRLPLTSLHLGSFDLDPSDLESMLGALQPLEELKIRTHSGFHLPQLRLIIASLPRLRKLSLPMDYRALDDLRMDQIVPPRTQSQDRFCLASDIHLPEPQHESAEKIARYLFALRPNMRYTHVTFSDSIHWEYPMDVLINEALSRLREALVGGE